jgi:hypothetical protein
MQHAAPFPYQSPRAGLSPPQLRARPTLPSVAVLRALVKLFFMANCEQVTRPGFKQLLEQVNKLDFVD